MTQPKYAPIPAEDEVRPGYHLPVPRPWRPHRPADFRPGRRFSGRGAGTPGPDQGYALRLARRFAERVQLAPGEHLDDALAAAVTAAMARAARAGRAPVATDVEAALWLLGYLGEADPALVTLRRHLVTGAAHDYWDRRALVAALPPEALAAPIAELRADARAYQNRLVGTV